MFRRIAILTMLLLSSSPELFWPSRAMRVRLERAMDLMREGNWAAAQIEARGDGQAAFGCDPVALHCARDSALPREVQDFLARNPDWPGLPVSQRERARAQWPRPPAEAIRTPSMPITNLKPEPGPLSLARAFLTADDRQASADAVVS
ncbi:hypothetical protein [Marivita sp.]|uniref:hypothetical protein n=1 Tax=Marivita sp. TaxID=2003365 RepID=UPI003B593C66